MSEKSKEINEIKTYQEAWEWLIKAAGSAQKASFVLAPLREFHKDDFPFITVRHYKDGEPENYASEIEGFPSYLFGSELETNLANALFLIYTAHNEDFKEERFRMVFQLVLELLNIESDWRM